MMQPRASYIKVIELIVALLLAVYPSMMFSIKGGINGAFTVLLVSALCAAILPPSGLPKLRWRREFTAYVLSMLSLAVALLISECVNGNFNGNSHDAPARYWLVIPIFLLLIRLPLSAFRFMQIGFPAAALVGIVQLRVTDSRSGIDGLDLIHFGDSVLILGVLSLMSLNWLAKDGRFLVFIKICGFVAGIVGSFLSGSRGGWLAIPILLFVYFYYKADRISFRLLSSVIALSFGLFLAAYITTATFQQRVDEIYGDVVQYADGNKDTSIGIRFQLYKAGFDIFLKNPFFGVGRIGFETSLTEMAHAGTITAEAAKFGRAEAHSDILAAAVSAGVLGLAAILAVYLVPLILFWSLIGSQNIQVRQTALMGVAFTSSVMVFGLTVEFFRLTLATAFYSLTVAALLAFCYNTNQRSTR